MLMLMMMFEIRSKKSLAKHDLLMLTQLRMLMTRMTQTLTLMRRLKLTLMMMLTMLMMRLMPEIRPK